MKHPTIMTIKELQELLKTEMSPSWRRIVETILHYKQLKRD